MTKRVGVIGGGQLAWMMAREAKPLDIELFVQTPNPDDPAVALADGVVFASIDSVEGTAGLASLCDVITFENEFVNLPALEELAGEGVTFYPSLESLAPLLDKYDQRSYLKSIDLPVPDFARVENLTELEDSAFPIVLKARRHGYDGQGTFIFRTPEELRENRHKLQKLDLLREAYVPFDRELAIIAARGTTGEIVIYPVVETYQKNQVCHRVLAPASVSPATEARVREIARHLLESLQVVGVFGIELFLTPDGEVLVNEIAPRTHNSGHYTLDASRTSQFAAQLQAVTGLPLGSPDLISSGAVMVNLLGFEVSTSDYADKRAKLAAIPGARVHWYGKTESRPGRKLGHVTVLTDTRDRDRLVALAEAIENLWYVER
ncbi:5-(carboxyamino)imidazole ribonucleotide synthase [Pannus brasiliensis CCIBt3594]|uniref:N5-carboxyaminoimidazole ribonucleotide synthase n=1 Tax=Pannus brasiliensis CCIBt3594 TaxID=1427578 RepID=A0AAW9R1V7_9CHRO